MAVSGVLLMVAEPARELKSTAFRHLRGHDGIDDVSSQHLSYWAMFAFKSEMALFAFAGADMALFQFITFRDASDWDQARRTSWPAKITDAMSVVFWIGVVAFGR